MAKHICGVEAALGDGKTPALKLQTNRPLFYVKDALPGFGVDAIAEWYEEAFSRWSAVADIKTRRITDLAEASAQDVVNVITVANLPAGVLADQQLPAPGLTRPVMRLSKLVTWKRSDGEMGGAGMGGWIDPVRTLCHEQGHFIGHQHFPEGLPPELMEPFISDEVIAPQPTEARVTAGWFGDAVPPDGPPSPTDPDCRGICELLRGLQRMRRRIPPREREGIDRCVKLLGQLGPIFAACPQGPSPALGGGCAGLLAAISLLNQLGPILDAIQRVCPRG